MDDNTIPKPFFEALQAELQPGQLILDAKTIENAEKNTLGVIAQVGAICKPLSTQDVQKLVLLAEKFGVRLYPISTGCNWGLGSAIPLDKRSLVVDLSSMNKILDFDEKTGIVTLQPGVTQGMLRSYLDSIKAPFMSSITGAGPHTSVVGNLLDKGLGITGASVQSIRAVECVLPDGSLYHDGKNPLCKNSVSPAIRVGLGPLLDGFFVQSDVAIITAMTISLAHQPKYVSTIYIQAKSDESLSKTIDIYHAYNAIHGHGSFTPGRWSKNLFAPHKTNEYSYALVIASSDKGLHKSRKKAIKRIVSQNGLSMLCADDKHIRIAQKIFTFKPLRHYFAPIAKMADMLDMAVAYTQGYPNEMNLREQYELLKRDIPEDKPLELARDGVGFIWYIVLFPATSANLLAFKDLIYQTAARHNMTEDPRFHVLPYKSDFLAGLARALFDLNDKTACEKAHAFYHDLLAGGMEKGFVPHRVPIHLMHSLVRSDNSYWAVLKKIKTALDPHNIIAPDKYWS